nr:anaerobic ribonucleoside-triphosphate reductase activating protein [uncultured Selenomonas sp.]
MASVKLAGTVSDSIVDGAGIRYTIFTQGCPHHCPGCQNPKTHDFAGGLEMDTRTILKDVLGNPLLTGVTLSGGEPFCQAAPLASLAHEVHAHGMDVWAYTGYTLEDLQQKKEGAIDALLGEVDVLVDGAYEESERDLTLAFRGSRNQRVIDMKKTRETGGLVLWQNGIKQ